MMGSEENLTMKWKAFFLISLFTVLISVAHLWNKTYQDDMAALMAYLDPLAANPIVSAGMSDVDIDWPEGVLYYATRAGEDNAKTDLLSVPTQATYNGYTVTKVTNAGYAIDHLGDAAVTLGDIEQGLQNATSEQVMGIVVSDNTIEKHFDQIAPLFQLLQQYGRPGPHHPRRGGELPGPGSAHCHPPRHPAATSAQSALRSR